MKKQLILIALFLMAFYQIAMSQGYEILENDPSKLIKGHVAFEYMAIDAGFGNLSGAYPLAVGLNAYYPLLPSLGIEGSVRTPLIKFEQTGGVAVASELRGE